MDKLKGLDIWDNQERIFRISSWLRMLKEIYWLFLTFLTSKKTHSWSSVAFEECRPSAKICD